MTASDCSEDMRQHTVSLAKPRILGVPSASAFVVTLAPGATVSRRVTTIARLSCAGGASPLRAWRPAISPGVLSSPPPSSRRSSARPRFGATLRPSLDGPAPCARRRFRSPASARAQWRAAVGLRAPADVAVPARSRTPARLNDAFVRWCARAPAASAGPPPAAPSTTRSRSPAWATARRAGRGGCAPSPRGRIHRPRSTAVSLARDRASLFGSCSVLAYSKPAAGNRGGKLELVQKENGRSRGEPLRPLERLP